MKFFFIIKTKILFNKQKFNFKNRLKYFRSGTFFLNSCENNNIKIFTKFLVQDGLLLKEKVNIATIFTNFHYFFINEAEFISRNYPSIKSVLENLIDQKWNYLHLFEIVINLIKPPFIIKSILVPKKLRKKTKQKYIIKIVYKNEQKRIKSSYKQLYSYSNKFGDTNFKIRLYKSLMFSFLDWKTSYLFKLKSMVFKKFFKI